ncbi:MAG: hypothetical protein ACU85E_10930 [Gammaproteobacteria bacterium]
MAEEDKWNIDAITRNIYINEIIFIGLICLSFIGDVIGSLSSRAVIFYWLMMVPIFFVCSLISERSTAQDQEKQVPHFLKYEFIFWTSAFISVLLVLFLWHAEALQAESTGLVIHIILAHTMFLTGTLLGMRFYLIGLFLFMLAGLAITMSGQVGLTFILAIPVVILGLYYEKYFLFPSIRKKHDKAYWGDE